MYPDSFCMVTLSLSRWGLIGGLDEFQYMDGDISDAVVSRDREMSANGGI